MKKDFKIPDLITAGIIGASLGKLITGKNETAFISSLVGIAATATYKSFLESAKKHTVLIIDNHKMYEVDKNGNRKFIKNMPPIKTKIPKTFEIHQH